MADDWIKMRTDLYRDPKVICIADYLAREDGDLARYVNQHKRRDMTVTSNVMRNVTCGALLSVWGVTRRRGKRSGDDLLIRNVTLEALDDIADLPGFGEAMASVGWVEECDKGLLFPNFFEELNTDPHEQQKAANAERQRRYREKKRNVTVTSQSNTEKRRVEKSREEDISNTSTRSVSRAFAKPTVDEIRAYCSERKNSVDAQKFFDFYESKGWKVGKTPMKDWRASVRTWEKNDAGKPGGDRFTGFVGPGDLEHF